MLILTSNGLSSPALLRETKIHGKGNRAALVVTADNEYKEKNYHVPRLSAELSALGFTVDLFDFDTQTSAELMTYDVVELIGGNPYYLLHSIQTHGFSDSLREFAEEKTLIGCSAGASVLTPSLSLLDLYTPQMNFLKLTDLAALHLTNLHILPHYSKFLKRFDRFEETCAEFEKQNNLSVIRLNDGDGVILTKEESRIIRC